MGRMRFRTFGCKANQYDTQVLREALGRRGWSEEPEAPDLVVLNTCAVTAEAGRSARRELRRLHRAHPAAQICVTGCLAESEGEALAQQPGVAWVLGNGEAKRPVNFLRELGETITPEELGVPPGICEFSGHTRAFLKIQDGCDMSCAFCIIPRLRGGSRSRPVAELKAEVVRLLAAGHVEIVLCGIHIGHWGREWGLGLSTLVRALADVEAPAAGPALGPGHAWRLRLSSIEATEIDDDLLALLAERPERLATHLHMPLQSGDDRILAAMGRWYGSAEYLAACDRIRARLERPAFTTDILVGFPGEDDDSFNNTLKTASRAGFARLHIFPFSPRPGTPAASLGNVPAPSAVRERRAALADLGQRSANAYRRSLVGLEELVVLEGSSGLCGRYQRLRISGCGPVDSTSGTAGPRQGELVPVRLALDEQAPGYLSGSTPRARAETAGPGDPAGPAPAGRAPGRPAPAGPAAPVTLLGHPLPSSPPARPVPTAPSSAADHVLVPH